MLRKVERFCGAVDTIAGILLALVMLLIVASTAGRYLFSWPIPDSFDLSRLMVGACVMWGLASIGYRGGHIAVDLVHEMAGKTGKRFIDLFAWFGLLVFTIAMTWMMFYRVTSAYASNESTFDLRMPVWPFFLLIWVGCAASAITVTFSIFRRRSDDQEEQAEGYGI
ncbi:TRAP transporter small permease [Aquamicrobium zhengzhouense]|uniref:TRAP transporter small permease protein n=1 Tax=Aquamicrobium zhengzhouense TaxID=2781738 RepID=A0ABS0S9B3_9HYPH|nr:TRAP transporter small permease [Aquamicrobium zhengzhouense]MBI1619881.1 TRAP transporter small permease [Aquamicrobium zhengzhouense]